MAFDVFISYASKDKTIADAVCARLESAGIRCWIAPRDIVPGTSYGQSIIEAIHGAKAMVLVFSSSANASPHIPKEVERAVSHSVPIIPFRIEDVAPGDSLDYFISSVHWLDAINPPMEKHLNDLATTIHKLFPAGPPGVVAPPPPPTRAAVPPPVLGTSTVPPPARSSSNSILIGVLAVALMAAIVIAVVISHNGSSQKENTVVPPDPSPSADANPAASSGISGHTSSGKSSIDGFVGCYQWFNNAPVTIRANGTATGGPFTGHWRLINASQRSYAISWPPVKETDTIAADQRSMSGSNEIGVQTSAVRISGTTGLTGVWRASNGAIVTFFPNSIFSIGTIQGHWRPINAAGGVYELTWPGPVDGLTLSPDGLRVSGLNQYGVAVSGVKSGGCS